ncbi:MAG: prepilin peptidase, partial [Planctomycetota bacterium]
MMSLATICALAGLIFGSFANVLVHRLPRGQSIVRPGSHCPACGHTLSWYENLPLLSWLALRGRCRACRAPIPVRYPLMELGLGLLWGYLGWRFGWRPELIMALTLTFLLWTLSWIDLETGLLPDALTLPGVALGLAFAWWMGDWRASLIGAVVGYGIFWLVARLFLLATGREGMGYGDFKLLAMLGAFLGWQALPFVIFLASATGAVVGGLWLWLTRESARAPIPFGPFLAA